MGSELGQYGTETLYPMASLSIVTSVHVAQQQTPNAGYPKATNFA